MIIKTRSLTESLNKLYEAYEVEIDDEIDAIMDDDTLSDEEKDEMIDQAINKYDVKEEVELEESFVFMPIPDDEPGEWGLETQEELENEILSYAGKKIVKMSEATDGYFDIEFEDGVLLPAVSQNCIVHKTNESLNEAQLNENPLLAAAARAAIPAAIDVASNAISSVIDAKLNDGDKQDLTEDLEYEIYRDVWNAIYDIADADFISNLVPAVAAKVPAYNPDWFEDEDPSKPKYTMYLEKLVDVLTDGFMANYSE